MRITCEKPGVDLLVLGLNLAFAELKHVLPGTERLFHNFSTRYVHYFDIFR